MADRQALRAARQLLECESGFGLTEITAPPAPASGAKLGPAPRAERAADPDKAARLSELYDKYKDCVRCPLGTTRTKFVFGQGDPNAELLFIGEAPGFEEDQQGLPFVGAAGQLLTKIIIAMKLTRETVYIANCLKCRPPNNRPPLPDEIDRCNPILKAQIEIIRPKVICALGKFAAQSLLGSTEPISRLRGRFHDHGGVKLMPTFHPAYLLRNPGDKKLVWQDAQLIMRELGLL